MDESQLRVGDAERRQATDALQRHYVEGRLTAEELAERVRQATAARTRAELDAVLRDLPTLFAPHTTHPPPAAGAARPPAARGGMPGDLRLHLTLYALRMLLLVTIWLLTSPGGYFWPIWAMLGWGFAVAVHAVSRRV
ncbi:MAG TPA: DUF1707 domain-containing protein [Chloroflexota bacterium]|nr:DUF1707 domain-containing protein [Chloroflexota bacterium]